MEFSVFSKARKDHFVATRLLRDLQGGNVPEDTIRKQAKAVKQLENLRDESLAKMKNSVVSCGTLEELKEITVMVNESACLPLRVEFTGSPTSVGARIAAAMKGKINTKILDIRAARRGRRT